MATFVDIRPIFRSACVAGDALAAGEPGLGIYGIDRLAAKGLRYVDYKDSP